METYYYQQEEVYEIRIQIEEEMMLESLLEQHDEDQTFWINERQIQEEDIYA